MINAVYHVKALIFIGATFREKLVSHHQTVMNTEILLNTYDFIKALSVTVLNITNAIYHDKALILSGLRFERSLSPIIRQLMGDELILSYL